MRHLFSRSGGKMRGGKAGRKAARPGAASPAKAAAPDSSNPYAAVAIQPGMIACDEVQRHAGRRVLQKDAPLLPVPGCDQAQCQCRYRKFRDRRSGAERRLPFGHAQLTNFMPANMVERQKTDRRVNQKSAGTRRYFNDYD